MCDQTEVIYSAGDVVWVKIGPIWWPGAIPDSDGDEIKELLEELRFTPLAIVKFFNEAKYEFVKNLQHIYHYNCRRKDEFIKKGLEKFRKGAQHMSKFPSDVSQAEELVGGDASIIKDPKFAPVEKTDYSSLFGSAKKKVKKEEETPTSANQPKKRLIVATPRNITKFKQRKNIVRGPLVYEGAIYNCPFCSFTTLCVANVSTHFRAYHSKSRADYSRGSFKPSIRSFSESKKAKVRPSNSGKKKIKVKTEESETKQKSDATPLSKPSLIRPAQDAVEREKKKKFTDALLADWSEEEDVRDDDQEINSDKLENFNVEAEQENDLTKPETVHVFNEKIKAPVVKPGAPEKVEKKDSASCFDFDEEDDGFIGMSNANTYGRKIPRVIPLKDKTELGMDLDVDELFKKKHESSDVDESDKQVEVKPRKRGRPRKSDAGTEQTKRTDNIENSNDATLCKSPVIKTLAATRDRRPGARKSYVNEIIEKVQETPLVCIQTVEDVEEEKEETPSKPSRRKQDLKRQSLVELDELNLVDKKKKEEVIKRKKLATAQAEDILSKVDTILAETSAPSLPFNSKLGQSELLTQSVDDSCRSASIKSSLEEDSGTIEYLEEEENKDESAPEGENTSKIVKHQILVTKSSLPQWKQDVRAAMVTNKKDINPPKDILVGNSETPSPSAKIAFLPKGQKGGNTVLLVKPSQTIGSRPKILSKQSNLMVVGTSQQVAGSFSSPNRVKVVTQAKSPTNPSVVQVITDGKGGKKLAFSSKKVLQFANAPQKVLIGGNDGLRVFENLGAKAVYIRDKTGAVMKSSKQLVGLRKMALGDDESRQCIIKRVKGPDGKYTIQKIVQGFRAVKSPAENSYVVPQKSVTRLIHKPEEGQQESIRIIDVKPGESTEPMESDIPTEEQTMEQPTSAATTTPQQVVAMPGPAGPDGQPTYVLVTVDENGLMQGVDSSIIAYDNQSQMVSQPESNVLLMNPSEPLIPTVYSSASQDILAEALANTNVLADAESPIIIPPVGESSHTAQSSLITMSGVMPDSTAIVVPVVHETSVTLQKPIMTPVEVPSAIVPNASGLQPPPLPPTPTEDILMEESTEGGLMIAEQQATENTQDENKDNEEQHNGDFFIEDSQGEEANSFQSMPLLNEESTASEEPIADQNFEAQSARLEKGREHVPTSTNEDLEVQSQELLDNVQEDNKRACDMPLITDEVISGEGDEQRPQETEVTSTTEDVKEIATS